MNEALVFSRRPKHHSYTNYMLHPVYPGTVQTSRQMQELANLHCGPHSVHSGTVQQDIAPLSSGAHQANRRMASPDIRALRIMLRRALN